MWTITAYDTEFVGKGQAQLVFTDDSDAEHIIVGKGPVENVYVMKSLDGTEGAEPADPYDTWLATITLYKTQAVQAAATSEASEAAAIQAARDAEAWSKGTVNGEEVSPGEPGYQDNAKYYKDAAERAVAHLSNMELSIVDGYLVLTTNE